MRLFFVFGAILEIIFLVLFIVSILDAPSLGRELASQGRSPNGYLPSTLSSKKKAAWFSYFLLLALLFNAECLARMAKADSLHNPLFWIHLPFAAGALFCATAIQFWKNGLRAPSHHKKWVCWYLRFLVGLIPTGAALMVSLYMGWHASPP